MSHFKIKEPYWKYNAVGLAEKDMTSDTLIVEILYKNVSGNREYPGVFTISKNKAMLGREHIVKKTGTRLRIVPINQLERKDNE